MYNNWLHFFFFNKFTKQWKKTLKFVCIKSVGMGFRLGQTGLILALNHWPYRDVVIWDCHYHNKALAHTHTASRLPASVLVFNTVWVCDSIRVDFISVIVFIPSFTLAWRNTSGGEEKWHHWQRVWWCWERLEWGDDRELLKSHRWSW